MTVPKWNMILEVNEGFIWKITYTYIYILLLLYLYRVDIICIYYIELLLYIYDGYYIYDNTVIWPMISGFSR